MFTTGVASDSEPALCIPHTALPGFYCVRMAPGFRYSCLVLETVAGKVKFCGHKLICPLYSIRLILMEWIETPPTGTLYLSFKLCLVQTRFQDAVRILICGSQKFVCWRKYEIDVAAYQRPNTAKTRRRWMQSLKLQLP